MTESRTESRTQSRTAAEHRTDTATTPVTRWIEQHAHRLTSLDPEAPLTDLEPLAEIVRDAKVVAMGASNRHTHELSALSHRLVRFLVEQMGFRTLALEGDEAERVGLDAYVRTGDGDPRELLADARSFWQTEEILDTVRWMRAFNRGRPDDPVRFAGAHPTLQGPSAIEPAGLADIERTLAESTIRWQERTADKIVYWGGIAHTAVGDPRTVSPPVPPLTHRNAGSYLREHFGDAFVSIGQTFHHGMAPDQILPPPPEFADSVLGDTNLDTYLLDLRAHAPEPVRTWLDTPTRTRMIGPHYDPAHNAAYYMSGGSLTDWFDAVLHVREVTAVRFLF
ncbi:Erythromycin esterase [Streptomyces sp. YIM 130001]|uniref:erythromycin esterase family protein n=1 Tax=Streptomyces sp. YIM 130001 TaxID=2259644 RepID=UPI000E659361|nr:erythromycin esterase family protein [Streptomyces sp. YIM 130001]RII08644.1 Erythromycin esterase [Streptomyces sp. YIM 130001]